MKNNYPFLFSLYLSETTETIISIPSSAEAVQVSFTIDTDYAIIVDHLQFRNEIKQKLADTMHVKVKRITYLSVESGTLYTSLATFLLSV